MESSPFSYVNVSFVVFTCEIASLHDLPLSKQEKRDFVGVAAAAVGRSGGAEGGGFAQLIARGSML